MKLTITLWLNVQFIKFELIFLSLSYDSKFIQQRAMHPGKLVLYRRLAGKAHEKRIVKVHAASCPATGVVSIARMP